MIAHVKKEFIHHNNIAYRVYSDSEDVPPKFPADHFLERP
jgi:hypothetical protein